MKTNVAVVPVLNRLLSVELTAVDLYWLQGRMAENWGYVRLAEKLVSEAAEERGHAQMIIDRLLFIEASPVFDRQTMAVGNTIDECFKVGMGFESAAAAAYRQGIKVCCDVGDEGSRLMLERILVDTEEHVNWLESQLHLMDALGQAVYLQTWIGAK